MARVCELTGKRSGNGYHVSHSNHKTKRRFYPNLQNKRFYVPEWGNWVDVKLSTQALRSINKKGILVFLKEQDAAGIINIKHYMPKQG